MARNARVVRHVQHDCRRKSREKDGAWWSRRGPAVELHRADKCWPGSRVCAEEARTAAGSHVVGSCRLRSGKAA